jgi:HK97 gp10 family phage protein
LNNYKNVVTVKVDMGDLIPKLQRVGKKLARKSLRKAFRAVGKFWVAEVKGKVPILSGDLRNSIAMKITTNKTGTGGSVEVGPRSDAVRTDGKKSVGPGVYGMWVEFGLKKKKYPKQPFIRPVYDATSETVQQIFADVLKADLEEIFNG